MNPSPLAGEGWGEGNLSQAVDRNDLANRRAQTEQAIQQAIGKTITVQRRADGKPEILVDQELAVSAAHAGNLTLAVAGPGSIACDLEPVVA
jgi:enediyne polyketide synthase